MSEQELMEMLQAYSEQMGIPFEQLLQDFQSETPSNQQAFIQEISKNFQQGSMQTGGIPVNKNGYYELDPLEDPQVIIPSGDITMKGINYEIDAFDANNGKFLKRMKPNKSYKFKTDKILEKPVYAQSGTSNIDQLIKDAKAKLKESQNTKFSSKKRQDALMSQNKQIKKVLTELERLKNVEIVEEDPDSGFFGGLVDNLKSALPTDTFTKDQYLERLNLLTTDYRRLNKGLDLIRNENESLDKLYDNNPTGIPSSYKNSFSLNKGLSSAIPRVADALGRELLGDYDLNYGLFPELEKGDSTIETESNALQEPNIIEEITPSTNNSKKTSTRKSSSKPSSKDSAKVTTTETSPTRRFEGLDISPIKGREDLVDLPELSDITLPTSLPVQAEQDIPASSRRLIGQYDMNVPTSAYDELMYQSNQRISEPYRGTPNLSYVEDDLVEIDPIISDIESQTYGALQNVDTSSAAGMAYAAQIKANSQKAVIDAHNQVNQINTQIKNRNNQQKVSTNNQEEVNRVNADRQYVDDIQRSDAARNTSRLQTKYFKDQLEANRTKENNAITSTLMNLPQIQVEDNEEGNKDVFLDTSYKFDQGVNNPNTIIDENGDYYQRVYDRRSNQMRFIKIK